MTIAELARAIYRADIDAANAYYRETGNLEGYQTRARAARESWEHEVREAYRDEAAEAAYLEARAEGGRVYADLATGERVRVPSLAALYAVSDTEGAPAAPLIARMTGDFIASHTTAADLIRRA